MRASAFALGAVTLALGCAPTVAVVRNGGLGVDRAACAPDVDPCVEEAGVGATFAYWRIPSARRYAGPAVSNVARLEVTGLEELSSGRAGNGLATGDSNLGLSSGSSREGLASGDARQGLGAGDGRRGLSSGSSAEGLATGSDSAGLGAGGRDAGLASGASRRGGVLLRKSYRGPRLAVGARGEFGLTVQNRLSETVERLVIVDRVDPRLRVGRVEHGDTYALPDGSTRVVIHDARPLPPGGRRAYRIPFVITATGGGER